MERVDPATAFPRPPAAPDVEIEDEPSLVDGYVIMRPIDRWGREFFSAMNGRWFRTRALYEKGGVMRTRFPEATTVYETEERAAPVMAEMDDTRTAVLAAVPKRLEDEEALEADRSARRPGFGF